jgi:hypothetical protein
MNSHDLRRSKAAHWAERTRVGASFGRKQQHFGDCLDRQAKDNLAGNLGCLTITVAAKQ